MADRCFIYALSLDGTTYRYVGLTSSTWKVRWASHVHGARRQGGRRKTAVLCWIASHGPDAVRVTILELCESKEELPAAEQRWIKKLRDEGYALLNHTDGGEGAWGYCPTDEERAAMSVRMSGEGNPNYGKPRPVDVREKIAAKLRGKPGANKGVPKTEAHRAKLRGRVFGEETRLKMSESAKRRGANNKGKPMSEAQKEKLRAKALERGPVSEETRLKQSKAHKGLKFTPEHRARIAEALRGKPKSPEHRESMRAAREARKIDRSI